MGFYRLLIFALLGFILFIPKQLDVKIIYAILALAVALIPLFVKNVKDNIKKRDIITIFFILFLASSALSTIFSIDPNQSLPQLLLYLAYFIIFTSIPIIFPTLKSKYLLGFFLLLITSLLSLISIYNTLIFHYSNREIAGVSLMYTYYGHNHLSALLLFAIPIAFYFLISRPHRLSSALAGVAFLLLLISLYFTFARASIVSLLLATITTLYLTRIIILKTLPILILVGTLLILIIPGGLLQRGEIWGIKKYELTNKARPIYWQQAFENFKKYPLFGSGLDTFRFVSSKSELKAPLKTNYAHNFFLQMLTDAGVVGFLSSAALILSVIWRLGKQMAENGKWKMEDGKLFYLALSTGIFTSTINTLVDFDWQLPSVFLIFWILIGIVYAK